MRFSQFTAILLALVVGCTSFEAHAAGQSSVVQTAASKTVKKASAKTKKKAVKKSAKKAKKAVKVGKKRRVVSTAKSSNATKVQYGVKGALLQPVEVSNKTYRYQEKGKVHQTIDKETSRQYGQVGMASYYGGMFHGRRTASGDIFNENGYTAAHKTLALGSYALVTNLRNGRKVIVRINDRGPFSKERIIDLSKGAARELGMLSAGVSQVRVEAMQVDRQGYISGKGANTLYQLAQKEGLPLKVKNTDGDLAFKTDETVLPAIQAETNSKPAVKPKAKAAKKAKSNVKTVQKKGSKAKKSRSQAVKKTVKTAKNSKKAVKTTQKKTKKAKQAVRTKASTKKKK